MRRRVNSGALDAPPLPVASFAHMEHRLQDPKALAVSSATHSLLDDVSAAVNELNRHRPLSEADATRLRRTLLPDRVTASLNMEGINATRRQTLAMMDLMRVEENSDAGEKEIYNALMADEFIADAVERGVNFDESFLREINRLLITGLRSDAGAWRPGDVKLLGADLVPPPGPAVPGLVRAFVEQFPASEALQPVMQAAWIHNQFTYIHPFNDGNGRSGRLLQDWCLIRRGYWPTGVPSTKRDDYYAALQEADAHRWDDLVELLAILQLDVTSKVRAVLDEPVARSQWVNRLASAAAAKRKNTRHKQYVVWRQRIEDIVAAFRLAAKEVDASSDVIGVAFRDYSIVDFREWERLCERGTGDRTWIFSMLFFADGKPFYKGIAYLKRHQHQNVADTTPPQRDMIGVFLTGVPIPEDERADFSRYDDPHIRLREVLPTGEGLRVYTENEDRTQWDMSLEQTPSRLVEQYFIDVFERKAGLGA